MRLVDDNIIVKAPADLFPEAAVCKHPYRTEEVIEPFGSIWTDQQFTKGMIAQYVSEGGQRLLQDFLPVGYEQQTGLVFFLQTETLIIKS